MRWRAAGGMRGALIVIACAATTAVPGPALAQNRLAPTWAVDPARPGRDAPPAGRSLFDGLTIPPSHWPGDDPPPGFDTVKLKSADRLPDNVRLAARSAR